MRTLLFLLLPVFCFGQKVIRLVPASYDGRKVQYVQEESVIKDLFERRPFEIEIDVEDVTLVLKRSFVFSEDFKTNLKINKKDIPLTYRGKVKGEENSAASVTIYGDKIRGSYSYNGESIFFSPEEEVYNALPAMNKSFDCRAEEVSPEPVIRKTQTSGYMPCLNIRLEVDKDVFDKFKTEGNLTGFITGVWNEVFYLFEKEGITMYLSEVIIHKDQEKYDCDDSYDCLQMLGVTINSSNQSDLTQLWKLSTSASGGIAWLPGLCSGRLAYRTSYAGIEPNYQIFPNYSWTVMVAAHEIGHNLGANHTHACVWNGNNTAIDGCYKVEGSCGDPGLPSEGGTVMSYCHLTKAGINFNLGFGEQPGDVMRQVVSSAACVGNSCKNEDCIDVNLEVKYDFYPYEIGWKLYNSAGDLVESSSNAGKFLSGKVVNKTICLPVGCYKLILTDTEGDGMISTSGSCSAYGYFKISDHRELLKTSGWGESKEYDICIGGTIDNCEYINFDNRRILRYTEQDLGGFKASGNEIEISGNAWKCIEFPYKVTRNTIIEFEFYSDKEAEIHAIGLDTGNTKLNPLRSIQVYGDQKWGYQDNNNYSGGWKYYKVAIGEQYYRYKKSYIGDMKYMFFLADDDKRVGGNSIFRNIKIYEAGTCEQQEVQDFIWHSSRATEPSPVKVYPNPADNYIIITDKGRYEIYNTNGQIVADGLNDSHSVYVCNLVSGYYFVKTDQGTSKIFVK